MREIVHGCSPHPLPKKARGSKERMAYPKTDGTINHSYNLEEKPLFEEWDFYQLQTMVGASADKSYSEAIVFNGGAAPGDDIAKKVKLPPIWIPNKEKEAAKKEWQTNRLLKRQQESSSVDCLFN